MKIPVREITGNLVWTVDGTVWALWAVQTDSSSHLSVRAQLELHARTRAALMAIGATEAAIWGVCDPIDPERIVQATLTGVDLDSHPELAADALEDLDRLCDLNLWERRCFLGVQLPAGPWTAKLRAATSAAAGELGGWFGLPAARVGADEVAGRRRQADELAEQFSGRLRLQPATPGDIRWLVARAARVGLDDPPSGPQWAPEAGTVATSAQLLPFADVIFLEGGSHSDEHRPMHRRYLRVEVPGEGVAYQTFSVVADMPHEWRYPGGKGEWFARCEDLFFPVDWCARIRLVPNGDAQIKARRQHRQLLSQIGEYDAEISGVPASLGEAIDDIDELRARLAANTGELECQTTIILRLAAEDLPTLESRAKQLSSLFSPSQYALFRPTGGQEDLYEAMLPGSRLPGVCRHYVQFLLPGDLAGGAPFAGTSLGDRTGMFLGTHVDGAAARPVLLSPDPPPSDPGPRSMGFFGASGQGKSHTMKLLMRAVVTRGGQVVAVDHSPLHEYVRLAEVMPGSSQVIDLAAEANVTLDPLQVFTGSDRLNSTIGFLSVLLGTVTLEHDGHLLAEAVNAVIGDPAATLHDVLDQLETKTDDPTAVELATNLRTHRDTDLGRIVFARRPPVQLDADYIVFAAQGLRLPSAAQLFQAHLAKRILPEQVLSQALLYLVTAVTRAVTWSDPNRFGVAVLDEVLALTRNVEGRELISDGLSGGRKHAAAVWVAGQDTTHISDANSEDDLAALIPIRFLFPMLDRHSAARAVDFLGLDDPTGDVRDLLTRGTSPMGIGECLLHDAHGRVGRLLVKEARGKVAEAMETDPEKLRALAAVRPTPATPRNNTPPETPQPATEHKVTAAEAALPPAAAPAASQPSSAPTGPTTWTRPSRRRPAAQGANR